MPVKVGKIPLKWRFMHRNAPKFARVVARVIFSDSQGAPRGAGLKSGHPCKFTVARVSRWRGHQGTPSRAGSLATERSTGLWSVFFSANHQPARPINAWFVGLWRCCRLPRSRPLPSRSRSSRAFLFLFSLRKEHHKPINLVSKRAGGLVFVVVLWPFGGSKGARSVTNEGQRAIVTARVSRAGANCHDSVSRSFREVVAKAGVETYQLMGRAGVEKDSLPPTPPGQQAGDAEPGVAGVRPGERRRGARGARRRAPRGERRGTPANPRLPG